MTGTTWVAFYQRLGADWEDLADALEISSYERRRFQRGDEGRGIHAWLEDRHGLHDLPSALEAIGRSDLVALISDEARSPGAAASDDEHWSSRSRGAWSAAEPGFRFRGRRRALERIVKWLADEASPRALVVTGSPGVGKSAVLSRIVITADPERRGRLPGDDEAVPAKIGSVQVAVHARDKDATAVAMQIGTAAGVDQATAPVHLAPALRRALESKAPRPEAFNIVIDALDEAKEPLLIAAIAQDMVQNCFGLGVRVVVGTRRKHHHQNLVALFDAAEVIDLDKPADKLADESRYFDFKDVEEYALASLQLVGMPRRKGNPYNNVDRARRAAQAIARAAEGNFLVAGLTARNHGLHDTTPAPIRELRRPRGLARALFEYIQRLAVPGSALDPMTALRALAHAQDEGFTSTLWAEAVSALAPQSGHVDATQIEEFIRSPATNFIVETVSPNDTYFRLFHQALVDTLRTDPFGNAGVDAGQIYRRFRDNARASGWSAAPPYVRKHLARHAADAGWIDDLLVAEHEFLGYADLHRLVVHATAARTGPGRRWATLIRLSLDADSLAAADRWAQFSVTNALEHLDLPMSEPGLYHARWATTPPRREYLILDGHTEGVNALCPIDAGDATVLATASADKTVRLWDVATGRQLYRLDCDGQAFALCPIELKGLTLLAIGHLDGRITVRHPVTGRHYRVLHGHADCVRTLTTVDVGGRLLLASGDDDGLVRAWDLDAEQGHEVFAVHDHEGWVTALVALNEHDEWSLLSAGRDDTIRFRDGATGIASRVLRSGTDGVTALAVLNLQETVTITMGGDDGRVILRDIETWELRLVLDGHVATVTDIMTFPYGDTEVLVTASVDGSVQLWDPNGEDPTPRLTIGGHNGGATALGAVDRHSTTLLATASIDGLVRVWDVADLGTANQAGANGHPEPITDVCLVDLAGDTLVASASASASGSRVVRFHAVVRGDERELGLEGDVVWITSLARLEVDGVPVLAGGHGGGDGRIVLWDLASGAIRAILPGHEGGTSAITPVRRAGRTLLATGGLDGKVRLWEPEQGEEDLALDSHPGGVMALCVLEVGGRTLLASGGNGNESGAAIQIWDLVSGDHRTLPGHRNWVSALCPIDVDGHRLLASGGGDHTVKLWDVDTGAHHRTLVENASANALAAVAIGELSLLATASESRTTVNLWNPNSDHPVLNIPVRAPAQALAVHHGTLIVGLATGLLAIDLVASPPTTDVRRTSK